MCSFRTPLYAFDPVCFSCLVPLRGSHDGSGLKWLDAPAPGRVQSAVELLQELGALGERGEPTDEGRRMARWEEDNDLCLRGCEWSCESL